MLGMSDMSDSMITIVAGRNLVIFSITKPPIRKQHNHADISHGKYRASQSTKSITNSWSVAVKHMWVLPPGAHMYLVEKLGGMHARLC